jgi:ribosomal protein S18 acetylase RimI-like enzyme
MSVIVLDAREAAVGFYRHNGYEVVGEGPVLFGEVRHSKMRKKFSVSMR